MSSNATLSGRKRQILVYEQRSAILVTLLTLLALLLGWGVKSAVSAQTRSVTVQGVTAAVPTGWLVEEGMGELVLVARNAHSLNERYRVQLLSGANDLATVAAERIANRTRLEPTFRVLAKTPIIADGRDSYEVTYAFIDDTGTGLPTVIEGIDYYFTTGDKILVVSLEANQESFEAALDRFRQFRADVNYGGEGGQ